MNLLIADLNKNKAITNTVKRIYTKSFNWLYHFHLVSFAKHHMHAGILELIYSGLVHSFDIPF